MSDDSTTLHDLVPEDAAVSVPEPVSGQANFGTKKKKRKGGKKKKKKAVGTTKTRSSSGVGKRRKKKPCRSAPTSKKPKSRAANHRSQTMMRCNVAKLTLRHLFNHLYVSKACKEEIVKVWRAAANTCKAVGGTVEVDSGAMTKAVRCRVDRRVKSINSAIKKRESRKGLRGVRIPSTGENVVSLSAAQRQVKTPMQKRKKSGPKRKKAKKN